MSKHTSGPLEIDQHEGRWYVTNQDEVSVALMTSGGKDYALMFAAAPDLLEALEALVKINDEHNLAVEAICGRPLGWKDSYLDAARAAIARAKGEQA